MTFFDLIGFGTKEKKNNNNSTEKNNNERNSKTFAVNSVGGMFGEMYPVTFTICFTLTKMGFKYWNNTKRKYTKLKRLNKCSP